MLGQRLAEVAAHHRHRTPLGASVAIWVMALMSPVLVQAVDAAALREFIPS